MRRTIALFRDIDFAGPRACGRRLAVSLVAARAVSPANRRLPASRISSTSCSRGLRQCLAAAELGNRVLVAQAVQYNADLLFGGVTLSKHCTAPTLTAQAGILA